MRPLGGRLDESEMLGSAPYTYYGGKDPPPPPPPRSALPYTQAREVLGSEDAGPDAGTGGRQRSLPPFYARGTDTIMNTP